MMLALLGVGVLPLLHRPRARAAHRRAQGRSGVGARSMAACRRSPASRSCICCMRGFAEGCAAMTGTEAISNGVMAFKAPAQKNAATTLGWMVAILATFFLGVSLPGAALPRDADDERDGAVDARPSRVRRRPAVLRAAVHDVRRARAGREHGVRRLPAAGGHSRERPLHAAPARRARRPAGVLERHRDASALVALLLVWLFHGDTNALVPLYAIGVFVCFTLSQAGMVVHWRTTKETGLALEGVAQRHRRGRHRPRVDHPARHQVHDRRLDRRADHSGDHPRAAQDPPALHGLRRGDQVHRPEPDHVRCTIPSSCR